MSLITVKLMQLPSPQFLNYTFLRQLFQQGFCFPSYSEQILRKVGDSFSHSRIIAYGKTQALHSADCTSRYFSFLRNGCIGCKL